MLEMLADVPPVLAGAWVVWFIAGGALVMWYRRAVDLEYAPAPVARPAARVSKPVSRQAPGVGREPVPDMPVQEAPRDESTPHSYEPPPVAAPAVARDKKPVVLGDPFGDLATLLDQAVAPPAAAAHRAPSESPILSSSGSPIRRANNEPGLG